MSPTTRAQTTSVLMLFLSFLAVGCEDPAAPSRQDPEEVQSTRGPTEHVALPAGSIEDERQALRLLAAHLEALCERDAARYSATLADDFQFFPRSQDLVDMPWLPGLSWGRTDELQMIEHMCDSTYVSPQVGSGVRSIDVHSRVVSIQPTRAGVVVRCLWFIVVMTTNGGGFATDSRFELVMAPTEGNALQIIEIREFPMYGEAVPQGSWGLTKNLFR